MSTRIVTLIVTVSLDTSDDLTPAQVCAEIQQELAVRFINATVALPAKNTPPAAPRFDHVRPPAVWSDAVAPGGYVCGAPDETRPDRICGYPVESEPCPEHGAYHSGYGDLDDDGPEPDDYDPGPEVDDEGGMSEYRNLPDALADAAEWERGQS